MSVNPIGGQWRLVWNLVRWHWLRWGLSVDPTDGQRRLRLVENLARQRMLRWDLGLDPMAGQQTLRMVWNLAGG